MAAAAGGGLRTGLEDHLYLDEDKKQPATNGALISQVLEAAARHGREIATPREVRNWLELDTT
jgi:uncharacterized protein (DUF849 family)